MIAPVYIKTDAGAASPVATKGHNEVGYLTVALALVERVYPSPIGGAVFTARDNTGVLHRFVAGYDAIPRPPTSGEVWSLEGNAALHPKYGPQITVVRAFPVRPSMRLLLEYLVRLKIGIGRTKASRLQKTFGHGLILLLDKGDAATLTEVLSQKEATRLLEVWSKQHAEIEVVRFLDHHGFNLSLSRKLLAFWGEEAIAKVQENPYRLLALAPWAEVDAAGCALGIPGDDPRRLIAATEAVLYGRLDQQHTWIGREALKRSVGQILGTVDLADQSLALAREQGAVAEINGGVQPLGAALMERAVEARFRSMVQASGQESLFRGEALEKIVEKAIDQFENDYGIRLVAEQRAAVSLATKERVVVLTGGAGVGKTTVLAAICRVFEAVGQRPLLMALSGRATQRLREATGSPGMTIAAYLAAIVKRKIIDCEDESEPIIILDEASMIDLPLMHRLLRALPLGVRLIMVGDPHQLPPIGFGLIFQIICISTSIPRLELSLVHRQAQATGIPAVATTIRRGSLPSLAEYRGKGSGVSFVEAPSGTVADRVTKIASDLGDFSVMGANQMTGSGLSARLGDGKNILLGGGSRADLHALWQRAHRQKRQEHLRPPTVSLPGVRCLPGTRPQESGNGPGTQGRGAPRRGHRAVEPAGRPARFRRGPAHDLALAAKKAESLPPLSQTLLPAEQGDVLELDELWSFVGSKLNARWVWIALCRQTRQVVAYFVGDRSADSARVLRERIPPAYRCRATRSDFWLAYAEVFPGRTHRSCDKSEGETCHVERFNNTLRQRLGRFVRKTLSFSKCERMHDLALRLFIHEYNQRPVS